MDKKKIDQEPVFSDDDVVRSVCEGRTQNFEILINRYKKKIVNFIHKMIFDHDEAQSLTQDVFLKVFEGIKKYRTQDTFQAYIFTIAKNLTLNYIKKQRRFHWFSNQPGTEGQEERYFRTNGTQEADMEKSQQEELLNAALKSLTDNQRIALILKVYLDLPYKKIAQITGWSEPKIETLISRAKSDMRDYIRSQETPWEKKTDVSHTQPALKEKIQQKRQEKVQEKEWQDVLEMRSI